MQFQKLVNHWQHGHAIPEVGEPLATDIVGYGQEMKAYTCDT
jgi:hypothetical protein